MRLAAGSHARDRIRRMSTDSNRYSVVERVLAYSAFAIIVIAVAAYLTTLVVAMVAGREALAANLWPAVVWISYVGLPIGFVLLMVLLGINFSRRGSRRDPK